MAAALGAIWMFGGQGQIGPAIESYRDHSVGVLLSAHEFSSATVKRLATQILEKHPGEKLFKIVFSTDPDEIGSRRWERNDLHWVYEEWRAAFESASKDKAGYAEVWKVRDNVGLAISEPNGPRKSDVLRGANPFIARCGAADLTILALEFQANPALRLYVQTPHLLDKTDAEAATVCLSKFVGSVDLEVSLARSPWFIADARYPVRNRLAIYPDKIPTKSEFLQDSSWFCSAERGATCIRFGPFR